MAIKASDIAPLTQARANLSKLAEQVKAGAEKIITRNGESYVALIGKRARATDSRQYVADDYPILSGLVEQTVCLLSIKHHRQLSFDFYRF